MTTVTFFFFQTEAEIKSFLGFFPIPKAQVDPVGVLPSGVLMNFKSNLKYVIFLSFFYKSSWDNWDLQCVFMEFNGHKSLSGWNQPQEMIHGRVSLSLLGTSKEFPRFAGNSQQLHTAKKKSDCQKSLLAVTSWTFTLKFPLWNFTGVILFCLLFK